MIFKIQRIQPDIITFYIQIEALFLLQFQIIEIELPMKSEPFRLNTSKINQPSKCKSLVGAQGDQSLQLSHSEINFVNTQPNELYEISMQVRNVTQNSLKIKMKKPASSFLSVHLSKEGPLASGLELKLTIVYDSKQNKPLTDKIVLLTDHSEFEIPISVIPQVPRLQFEPFLNMGFSKVGNTVEALWKITNEGQNSVDVQLVPLLVDTSAKLTISAQSFCIQGKQSKQIKLSLFSSAIGTVEGSIQIYPKAIGYSNLQFLANFCEYNRMISDAAGHPLQKINIDSLLAGESINISMFLVNNTPQKCQFRVTRKKGANGEQSTSLVTPQQIGKDDSQKLIQYSPSQGQLEPYSSTPLNALVNAKYQESDLQLFCNYILGKNTASNFEKQWVYTLRTFLNHEQQHLDLQIKGVSIIPKLGVTPSFFAFNECSLQKKVKKIMKVQNFSPRFCSIELESSANYTFNPKKLKINANSSANVEVIFHPKKVGQLNEICCLNAGVFSFPIKLFGKCIFNSSKAQINDSCCEQLPIEHLENICIQQDISAIPKGKASTILSMDNSKNTIHFDTYRQGSVLLTNIQTDKSSANSDNYKKTRILKNKNGKQVKLDLNHLNPNQLVDVYPSTAKSQQEERIVSRELSSHQLRSISVGSVVIEIGNIFMRSTTKKAFHICNFNPKPISIRLESFHDSFSETVSERQILPAQSHGGFNIVFQALSEGPFKHTLQYVLNGNHYFELMVTGHCIQPTLTLSRNDLKFIITEEDKKFQKKEAITFENNFDYDVQYEWKSPVNTSFEIEPMSGCVKANSQLVATVNFNFEDLGEGTKIEQAFKLKVKYGKTIEVKCIAIVPESSCICKTQQIRFGDLVVGKQYEQKLHLKNQSKVPTIFKVNLPKQFENIIVPSPKSGTLAAQEVVQIAFKINSTKVCSIDAVATIVIRGSKNIDIPIKANAILPSIRIQNDQIDFGSTPIEGNPAQKSVNLINDSSISVDLELRLHNQTFLAKYLKLCPINDSNMSIFETKETKNYKAIGLRINPKCKVGFTLEFTPETTQEYEFYLPLFLPNVEPLDELQKVCRCKGIKNKLTTAEKQVSFGKIVIEQIEQIYSKSQLLQIRNPQQQAITWWIQQSNLAPFRVDKTQGKLQGFEKCVIKIFFTAENPGVYKRDLQFFIDQTQTDISRCYMKVALNAQACFPRLFFDQPYLILPTVRLGQQSRSTLQIINGGYENINLKHTISQEYSSIDIKVKYPNGSNLGVTKKQIKVQISFSSDKPVSFTVKLNFHDNNNRTFTINISGTADQSTYTLLQSQSNTNSIDKSCHFLRHYLNSTIHLTEEIYDFPKSLIENDFEKFSIILCSYSQSFQKARTAIKKNSKVFFGFQYISQIIKQLKAEGAFLNHIRPQMLLNYEQYMQNIKIRAQNNQAVITNYKKKEKYIFQNEQKYSWLILFYQIFKVFSRVNQGKIKQGGEFWAKFSAREKILLSWLQKTYEGESGIEQHSKNNQILSTLNNGEVLSSLISKYTNIKILDCYGKPPKNQKDKQRRCRTVIQTFSQIGINCLLRLEDLLRCSEKQMLLVVENLYLILPSYLQKGQPIVFNCQFGQVVTKSVQITNPSKYPITYVAKIEGCKAYCIEGQSQFIIESKKTQEIKIKYISNINMNNSSATLTLTGKTNNKFTPSTFIFVLKSNILGRISEKNVQVSGNLYEQLDFTVKATNNFGADGQFKVQLQPSTKNTYSCFYLLNNAVKIKKGQTVTVNLAFIPFTLEQHSATLVFRDEKVGQFQYDLTGLVQSNIINQQTLRIPQNLFTNKTYQIEIQIPTRNDLMLRGRKSVQYIVDKLDKRVGNLKEQKSTPNTYEKYYPKLANSQVYTAKMTTPNASISLKNDQVLIKDIQANDDPSKREQQKLIFEINLKSPIKEGSFTINLKNTAGTDIRRYKIILNASARPLRYELQLKTPVNKAIIQQLPLVNITSDKNTYIVTLTASNQIAKTCFSIDCEKEIAVNPKQQNIVALTFKPKVQGTCTALLKMQNISTGQNIEYQLVGIGEQPQAEIIQFQQEVRKEKSYSIKIPIVKNAKCNVVSCSLDNAQYQKSFVASSQSPYFRFKILPKMSGRLEGKFIIEVDQTLFAFKVVINVKGLIEGQVKLRTIERKQVWGEVNLPKGFYTIRYDDHNLKCPHSATVQQQNGIIGFSYYSSKPQEKEITITFFNEILGEISYIVKVIVQSMPQIKMQSFKVQLGKSHKQKIIFQNTDDTPMNIISQSSHPSIFFPQKFNFQVQPRSQLSMNIFYKASSLQMEEGKIFFNSDKNAKWTYHLSGYGLPQAKPQVRQMTVFVGQQICQSLSFCNPLNKTLQYNITLQTPDQHSPFSTFLKSSKVDLAYNQEIQIPITLKPKNVALHKAILKIALNQKIFWKYELVSKTYFKSNQEPRLFKLHCREKNDQNIQFNLPYSKQYSGQTVHLKVKGANQLSENLIKSIIKTLNNGQSVINQEKVMLHLSVLSFKPINMQTQFQIWTQNGCKWIFRCDFIFIPPLIDDKFEIIAAINKPTSVKFKLTNRNKTYAKYNAYFTSDSCIQFTVNPKVGELEPYGREGTPIEVIFCPTQYKKSWTGKLVIETEQSYWSYEVKGSLPHYNPPVGKSIVKQ